MEIYKVKLKCTDINFIEAICGNPTPPFKMDIILVHIEGNVFKDTEKSWAAKLNCGMFPP